MPKNYKIMMPQQIYNKYHRYYRYLSPYRGNVALIIVSGSISAGLALVSPYLTKLIIDKAYGSKDSRLFLILIAAAGIIFVLNNAVNELNNYLNRYTKALAVFDLNRKIFKKISDQPYDFFKTTSTGRNLFKVQYDIEQISCLITDIFPQIVISTPKLFFIVVLIFHLNWKTGIIILALIPPLLIVPFYSSKSLKNIFKRWIENSEETFRKSHELLSHIDFLKAFGTEKYETRRYIKSLAENVRCSLANKKSESIILFLNGTINNIVFGSIILYGGYNIIKGRMTLGSFGAIAMYLSQLPGIQTSLAHAFQKLTMGFLSCDRIGSILDLKPQALENKQAAEIRFSKGRIEFKGVSFGYEPDKNILEKVNFSIDKGCSGLVGPSGCGKTTIANLILRLYDLSEGNIHVDGYDIKDIKSRSLYEQIGIASQEHFLWNNTAISNIAYGKRNADIKDVIEAAKIACAHDFISCLPNGYDTIIGENAAKISEGQKQRIAVARAIIKKPGILILDEALSCVDAGIENEIINNIKGSLPKSVIIIISHRLSCIRKMDLIYFLEAPDKVTIATHKELLRNNIKYRSYLAFYSKYAGDGLV